MRPCGQQVRWGGQQVLVADDEGARAKFDGELTLSRAPSPSFVDHPHTLETLDSYMRHIMAMLEEMRQQRDDDHNKVIVFLNELQHNQWDILDYLGSIRMVQCHSNDCLD